jgi:subtilisin family serine protease
VVRFSSESENPLDARKQLELQFQGTRFGPNFVYYHLESDGVTRRSSDAVAGAGSCDPQRCYAPALIDWRADLAACAAGVKIGIIDTAVDRAHPALAWKGLKVHRASDHDPANMEPHWHGTGVVSLLAGHPKSGTPGLVPDADYIIADAFFTNSLDKRETDTDHLLWALEVLERQGAQVVNMSLSGPSDPLVHRRLIELSRKGMVFVAAAGNGGRDAPPAYPAAYKDEVIAVTAVGRDQQIYARANRGDYIDVAAPGVRVWTALPNNKQGLQSGTSFAAPFVTAIVAAIYNEALLPAINRAHAIRTPEAVTRAHLLTEKVVRDDTVGLVRAPSNCAGERRQVPTARLAPAIELSRWLTRVEYVSSRSGN